MKKFTFTGASGVHTSVIAMWEADARDQAMFERWGEPDGIVTFRRPYYGHGLTLVSVEVLNETRPRVKKGGAEIYH